SSARAVTILTLAKLACATFGLGDVECSIDHSTKYSMAVFDTWLNGLAGSIPVGGVSDGLPAPGSRNASANAGAGPTLANMPVSDGGRPSSRRAGPTNDSSLPAGIGLGSGVGVAKLPDGRSPL